MFKRACAVRVRVRVQSGVRVRRGARCSACVRGVCSVQQVKR